MTSLIGMVLGLALVSLSYFVGRMKDEAMREISVYLLCAVAMVFSLAAFFLGLYDADMCISPCVEVPK